MPTNVVMEKQACGCLQTHAYVDDPTLCWLKRNFIPQFIRWPALFLSKPSPCLVLSALHHVSASIGQASSLTPPLPRTSPQPPTVLFKEKQDYYGEQWDCLNYTASKMSPEGSSLGRFYSIATQEYWFSSTLEWKTGGKDASSTCPWGLGIYAVMLLEAREGTYLSAAVKF